MLPSNIERHLVEYLTSLHHRPVSITSVTSLGGGCINESFRIETSFGFYFLKYNQAEKYPGMFASEAAGLIKLSEGGSIRIPGVVNNAEAGPYTYLLLEFIRTENKGKHFWDTFGRALAKLHKQPGEMFGWEQDNYIGSLSQSNHEHPDWNEFFILERLEPLLKLALDQKKTSSALVRKFESFYSLLPELLPLEKPALLHGDLWNGNFLVDETGNPCLIDPAVYFGHREVDLAMTRLFGGFSEEFYSAYHAEFPLEKGWEKRIDIFNLYPLLVHVNLFGGGYISDVERIMAYY
ncbi:MAG: fructosamine kinase family protein [Bacteroidales bacterium]|nr:fructosamine kinase family protein [Bacteroidales bacterium]